MTTAASLVDFAPALRLELLALVVASPPLPWWWLRQRGADRRARVVLDQEGTTEDERAEFRARWKERCEE